MQTSKIGASAGLVCLFDFINKLVLLAALWNSPLIGTFAITGMTLIIGSILGILESHLTNDVTNQPTILKIGS